MALFCAIDLHHELARVWPLAIGVDRVFYAKLGLRLFGHQAVARVFRFARLEPIEHAPSRGLGLAVSVAAQRKRKRARPREWLRAEQIVLGLDWRPSKRVDAGEEIPAIVWRRLARSLRFVVRASIGGPVQLQRQGKWIIPTSQSMNE